MMDWYLENADGVEYRIDVDEWKLELHTILDNYTPNKANVTLSVDVPTTHNQWIRAVEFGKTAFLGYISENPQSYRRGQKTIVAYGADNLLWECPCPLQTYWGATVYLSQVFGHADPDTTTDKDNIPGLLFAANSLIPPGWREDTLPTDTDDRWISHGPGEIIDATNGIVRYPNMGTRSRVGAAAIFVDGYPYTDVASYADMASGTAAVWRDEDDLYIRFWQSGALVSHWRNAPVYAKNAFDTRCRFGSIDTDSVLDVQLIVDSGINVGPVILNLARSSGQYLRFVYIGKICYMYVVEDFSDLGEVEILESECEKVKFIPDTELNPDAVTGAGHGGNNTRQFQSIFSTKPGNAYIRRVADFPYTFFNKNSVLTRCIGGGSFSNFIATTHHGMLFENTLAHWQESKKGSRIELELKSRNIPSPGSALRLDGPHPVTDQNTRICSIERDQTGLSRIVAGSELDTLIDARNGIQSINEAYATVRNDFNVVAEITDTEPMVDLIYYPDVHEFTTTQYITTWSYWVNSGAWGRPGVTAMPILTTYGYTYYRDNNVRLLLSLRCTCPTPSRTAFSRDQCYLYLYCRYNDTSTIYFVHPEAYLRYSMLEEDIVDWDITPYIPYGDSTNKFAFNAVIHTDKQIVCYKTPTYPGSGTFNYVSPVTATLSLKLVQLGYTLKRNQIKVEKTRCGGLTLR